MMCMDVAFINTAIFHKKKSIVNFDFMVILKITRTVMICYFVTDSR